MWEFIGGVIRLHSVKVALTDGGKDIGETEVVHSIEGQEMVEELLFLVITAQEGVSLVQFSNMKINKQCFQLLLKWGHTQRCQQHDN